MKNIIALKHSIIVVLIAIVALMAIGCGGGGALTPATPTSTSTAVVQTTFPVTGVIYALPATYVQLAQVELLRNGVTIATSTTNISGEYSFSDVATGTNYSVRASGAIATPYFIEKTVPLSVAATATLPIPVTLAARTVNAEAVNVDNIVEHFTGANYRLACLSTGYDKEKLALGDTGVFTDVPLANDCTLSITNPGTTTPGMASDTEAINVAITGDGATFTVAAKKPACVADTQCPIPLGQNGAVCLNAGASNAECVSF